MALKEKKPVNPSVAVHMLIHRILFLNDLFRDGENTDLFRVERLVRSNITRIATASLQAMGT